MYKGRFILPLQVSRSEKSKRKIIEAMENYKKYKKQSYEQIKLLIII
jgi:hypothetical protein